jgi:ParB-like chromosome segregation protein Spo0J
MNIPIEKIIDDFDFYYGRKDQDEKIKAKALSKVEMLKEDILKNGLKNPLIVFEENGMYQIKDGTHRIRALKELGWKEVPCIISTSGRQAKPYPVDG